VEALACREALALSADLMFTKVIVASDCQGAVDDINIKNGGLSSTIIREID
jgi:hypothetical protein